MKNPDRVAELLAELRELADNDFERHRIDVLEHDLTNPPTVEVIDDTHQCFNNETYTLLSGYFAKTSRALIHRVIWIYCKGDIPKGYHIHHIDGNKANNQIENLQLISPSEHQSLHHIISKQKKYSCKFCGKKFLSSAPSRPTFCSAKCYYSWQKETQAEIKKCPICGKEFTAYKYYPKKQCCSKSCSNRLAWQKRKANQAHLAEDKNNRS